MKVAGRLGFLTLWLALGIFVLTALGKVPAWAEEVTLPVLTLEDAVKEAWASSPDVTATEYAEKKAKEQRDQAADAVRFIPAGGENPAGEQAWVGLLKADMAWQIAQRQAAEVKENLALQVVKAYCDLVAAKKQVEAYAADVARAEVSLKAARVKLAVGMATKYDLEAEEVALNEARTNLAKSQEDLGAAYRALNRLLGRSLDDRYEVVEPVASYEAINREWAIAAAEAASFDIFRQSKQLEAEQWDLDFPYSGGEYKKYNVEINDVLQQTAQLESLRRQVRENAALQVQQLDVLYEQWKAVKARTDNSRDALKLAQARYNAGVISMLELTSTVAAAKLNEARELAQRMAWVKQKAAVYRIIGKPVLSAFGTS